MEQRGIMVEDDNVQVVFLYDDEQPDDKQARSGNLCFRIAEYLEVENADILPVEGEWRRATKYLIEDATPRYVSPGRR